MANVNTLSDRAKTLEALRRIARQFGDYLPAREALATELCASGRVDEGMSEAVRMPERLSADEVDSRDGEIVAYGVPLAEVDTPRVDKPGAGRVEGCS